MFQETPYQGGVSRDWNQGHFECYILETIRLDVDVLAKAVLATVPGKVVEEVGIFPAVGTVGVKGVPASVVVGVVEERVASI